MSTFRVAVQGAARSKEGVTMRREEQQVRLEIVRPAETEIKVQRPLYKRVWCWGIVMCIGWSSAGAWAVLSGGAAPETLLIITESPADLPAAAPVPDMGVAA